VGEGQPAAGQGTALQQVLALMGKLTQQGVLPVEGLALARQLLLRQFQGFRQGRRAEPGNMAGGLLLVLLAACHRGSALSARDAAAAVAAVGGRATVCGIAMQKLSLVAQWKVWDGMDFYAALALAALCCPVVHLGGLGWAGLGLACVGHCTQGTLLHSLDSE
jgi:hypothetical protein